MYTIDEVRKTLAFCVVTSLSEHRRGHLQQQHQFVRLPNIIPCPRSWGTTENWSTSPVASNDSPGRLQDARAHQDTRHNRYGFYRQRSTFPPSARGRREKQPRGGDRALLGLYDILFSDILLALVAQLTVRSIRGCATSTCRLNVYSVRWTHSSAHRSRSKSIATSEERKASIELLGTRRARIAPLEVALSDDLRPMILAQVCERPSDCVDLGTWIHKRESVRAEYVPNILNAFVHIANEEEVVAFERMIDTRCQSCKRGMGQVF